MKRQFKDLKIGETAAYGNETLTTRVDEIRFDCYFSDSYDNIISFNIELVGDSYLTDWFEDSVEIQPHEQSLQVCTCDLFTVIMRSGCQCGGR